MILILAEQLLEPIGESPLISLARNSLQAPTYPFLGRCLVIIVLGLKATLVGCCLIEPRRIDAANEPFADQFAVPCF